MERLPNWLTWARLIAVPIVMALIFVDDGREGTARGWATVVFGVAAATDFLDGYLARRWHVVSSFGKLADPLADKALVLGTLLALILVDGLPWWPFIVLLIREIAVTVGRMRVRTTVIIPASPLGKIKTTVQLVAIGLYLLPGMPAYIDAIAWWMLVASVALAIVSWVDYEARVARARRSAPRAS
jgi:CDP-diacylglycerol--glycerol-3-phosphate 3-phosphatidyltransferase